MCYHCIVLIFILVLISYSHRYHRFLVLYVSVCCTLCVFFILNTVHRKPLMCFDFQNRTYLCFCPTLPFADYHLNCFWSVQQPLVQLILFLSFWGTSICLFANLGVTNKTSSRRAHAVTRVSFVTGVAHFTVSCVPRSKCAHRCVTGAHRPTAFGTC